MRRLANGRSGPPEGVKDYRLNLAARSIVIEYDDAHIDPDLLDELARTKDDERAAAIVEQLHHALTETKPKEEMQ